MKMKAAVWTDYNKIEIEQVDMPVISENEVLIKVMAAGLCVTDLHVYTGKFKYGNPPHILGHEIAGMVCEIGNNVNGIRIGDRVVVETSIGCKNCFFCKVGKRNLCNRMTEIGFTPNNGGYAQYVKAPAENLFHIPDNVSYKEASIVESIACPMGALMRNGVRLGETVVVFGVGPAGLAFIQGARALGAGKIIAVARTQETLLRAKCFGADVIINTKTENVLARVLEETSGIGADLVCEAAGSPQTIGMSFDVVRNAGRVILYGIPRDSDKIDFPITTIVTKQIEIHGTVGDPFVWEPLLKLVSKGKINLKDMVTACLPLEKINEAFEIVDTKKGNPIKIVLLPWDDCPEK